MDFDFIDYLTGQNIMFVVLSAIVLGCGLMSVLSTKILRAATYLFFTLFGIAGLYLLMNYEFLAAVQLSVYAGAVVVLLIFAIFLVKNLGHETEKVSCSKKGIAALASVLGIVMTLVIVFNEGIVPAVVGPTAPEVDMQLIGDTLLGSGKHQYLLIFEASSVLLLACIIGAIVVATKSKEEK